ncbi:hypothetical protein H5410_064393, partial [Solanum commersonii]
ARELKQHIIIEVKHTRKYGAYDPFIIAQNAKQVVIKQKIWGEWKLRINWMLHNKMKCQVFNQVVDAELEMNLEHHDHILEEVNKEELDMPTNMEEDEEETLKRMNG